MAFSPALSLTAAVLFLVTWYSNSRLAAADAQGHHDHDHHDHDGHDDHGAPGDAHAGMGSYEWAGVFETPDPMYIWVAQAVGGAYADPNMRMVVMPAPGASKSALRKLEAEALQLLGGDCFEIEAGGTLAPGAVCYDLRFNETHIGQDGLQPSAPARFCSDLDTTFFITAGDASHLAFFTAHVPTEFERSQHYLKDAIGRDIEPEAEVMPTSGKPWGLAIGAAVIINLVALMGVVMLIPLFGNLVNAYPRTFAVVTNSFASGALLAAATFLLLYEATHLITITDKRTEAAASGAWGCMILLGFITAPLIEIVVHGVGLFSATDAEAGEPEDAGAITGDAADDGHPNGAKAGTLSAKERAEEDGRMFVARRSRIIGGILIGDFMHNLCDGFFVGAAFNLCGSSIGWTVAAATVYHEIAQELADFWVLTDPKQGGLRPWLALLLNFISGTSVVLGVLLVLGLDISNYATGLILAYGGGVYVHIAASECMHRVYQNLKNMTLRFVWLVSFLIGAAAIGLVLLDHEHCSPDAAKAHGHAH